MKHSGDEALDIVPDEDVIADFILSNYELSTAADWANCRIETERSSQPNMISDE
jgi:hypothetical protein